MSKIAVENNTKMPMYVAGQMIPAGETRHFEAWQLPPEHRPAAVIDEPAAAPDGLLAILAGGVKAIELGLAALSLEELVRLTALETEGKKRKGVLEAIEAESLRRARAVVEALGQPMGGPPVGGPGGVPVDGERPVAAGSPAGE
jgi:hypothetical protein